METANDSIWKKSFVTVMDQRQLALPPTWVATHAPAPPRSERGREVHESGRGRAVASAVATLLGQAREKAVVSSFLLADGPIEDAVLAAAKRGVRVYVLLASEARLGREESEGEFDQRVLAQHKAMLARLGGHALFRSAPHFHAKFVIIDPEARPAGLLLTANLTSEALERNEELAVALSPAEVAEAAAYTKWAMWESAEHEFVDPEDRFRAVRPLGKVPHPPAAAGLVATTSSTRAIREAVLDLVGGARSRILVSSFGWDANHEVVRRLCARAREGLEVTALARVRASSMPALVALAEAGARVFAFRWLHAKAIWTDAERALVMSANLQADGLDRGFELGVRLRGGRASEVRERLTAWRDAAPWWLAAAPTLGEVSGAAMLWHRDRLEDVDVKSNFDIDLGTVMAPSAEELEAAPPPVPDNGALPWMAHELRCSWAVTAPAVAPKSKEKLRPTKGKKPSEPYSPPVFREPGGRLVVAVRSPEDLAGARAVKAEVGAAAIVLAEGVPR